VTDDGHLRAVYPQRDPLHGELVADVQLPARQADQPGAVNHPLDLDRKDPEELERAATEAMEYLVRRTKTRNKENAFTAITVAFACAFFFLSHHRGTRLKS